MYKAIIVDDEYMILSGLEKLIEWEKFGVECVAKLNDGQEALEYVRTHPVDIVITDVSMPRLTGIEFVRKAQAEDINFNFIVLSGYQEFNYVREGIRLGAENFILKPIDEKELNETIRKTVKKLDDEKHQVESEDVLFVSTMTRWINDDIELSDLKRIMRQLDFRVDVDAMYSVIVIGGILEKRKSLWEKTMKMLEQPFYYFNEDQLISVVVGSNLVFDRVRKTIAQTTLGKDEILGLGELYVPIDIVPRSFDQAISMIELAKFYGDSNLSNQALMRREIAKPTEFISVSFEKFHHALSIGDISLISKEVEDVLHEAVRLNPDPEYIRYISFITFSDIYRQHKNFEVRDYREQLTRLNETTSLDGINHVLWDAIHSTQASAELKQYNANVQKALQNIYHNFTEDITLGVLAEELHLNAMYLGQLFKKETGKSYSQYLNQFRVEEAQKLLIHSNHNVNEIAELVGYTSSGYFYKNFKKECGISPKEYRDRYHQNTKSSL